MNDTYKSLGYNPKVYPPSFPMQFIIPYSSAKALNYLLTTKIDI